MIEHPLNQFHTHPGDKVFHNQPISTELFEGTDQELYEAYLRYRFLFEFSRLIASRSSIDDILDTLLDELITLINSERGLVIVLNPAGNILYTKTRSLQIIPDNKSESSIPWSLIHHVRKSRNAEYLQCDRTMEHHKALPGMQGQWTGPAACLPILLGSSCIGILYTDNRSCGAKFIQSSPAILQDFASLIAPPLARSLQEKELGVQVRDSQHHPRMLSADPSIIGTSPQIEKVRKFIDQVADTPATVILEGESGTGKEVVARALHDHSRRRDKPFVSLNCGALTETLLESELFGHIKGAFTGAVQNKKGWFETANGGTIFFDEIGEMSPGLQVKLLRILQTGEYSPVGSNEIKKSDVRIIVATNKHLESLVKQGAFRSDLFYRLNILYLYLPPLRERREDILLLAQHYLKSYRKQLGKPPLPISLAVQELLWNHDFPGNIRELQNLMQRAAVMAEGVEVQLHHLPESLVPEDCTGKGRSANGFALVKRAVVERFERDYVETTLERAHGVVAQAARIAGIDPKNFYQKMQKYRIRSPRW
ncbi:MAG TPA: sigma-54-dependent Fis family transcriptional regulator [bacterium]|nr:sigma-54-dependent Fis family transcriptional regulator [bacterium]HQI47481.1 sigma-54-dependent Fis family transcriptional regulator [bacterium]HQJ65320.1 sigma-54-dependent Fis family transcriptional regulator [bacterium]